MAYSTVIFGADAYGVKGGADLVSRRNIVTATCHYCGNTQKVVKQDMQPALCCQCKRPMEITSTEEDK